MLSYGRTCDVGKGNAGLNNLECGSGMSDSCQSSIRAPRERCLENIITVCCKMCLNLPLCPPVHGISLRSADNSITTIIMRKS